MGHVATQGGKWKLAVTCSARKWQNKLSLSPVYTTTHLVYFNKFTELNMNIQIGTQHVTTFAPFGLQRYFKYHLKSYYIGNAFVSVLILVNILIFSCIEKIGKNKVVLQKQCVIL